MCANAVIGTLLIITGAVATWIIGYYMGYKHGFDIAIFLIQECRYNPYQENENEKST